MNATIDKPTKAMSKRQRIRKKRERRTITLANGDTAIDRPTGRDRTHTNQPQEDARKTALEARVRVYGLNTNEGQMKAIKKAIEPVRGSTFDRLVAAANDAKKQIRAAAEIDQRKAMDAAINPLCSDGVGNCIIALVPKSDQGKIRDTWHRLCAAQHNYHTRILGVTGNPQGSAIAMLPEPIQTDTGHTIDIRSAEEKDAGAKRAWAAAEASINALPVPQWKWAIRNAMNGGIDGQGGDVWRDGKPTARGRVLVQALVALAGDG